jgi:hypothetical protein
MAKGNQNYGIKIVYVILVLAIIVIGVSIFVKKPIQNSGKLSINEEEMRHTLSKPILESMDNADLKNEIPNMDGGVLGDSRMQKLNADTKLTDERESSCFPKDQLTPDELLPQDSSSTWAQVNPEGHGTLKDKNFLQCGYHIGINTVGQTLRNANLQLRSEPPCPQVQVSPWLQSTIEPDVNRKPFEIGGCA